MHGREQRVLLRHYLEQGLSKTAIARTLHVSRRTVYHWITTEQLDRELDDGPVRYAPRPPVARKIDRYREIVRARLTEYPRLSATRLYEEIRAAGYAGGYTQVKDYVREVLRSGSTPRRTSRSGDPFRDTAWPPSPGGLCRVSPALGQAVCLAGGVGILAGAVVPVLSAANAECTHPRLGGSV